MDSLDDTLKIRSEIFLSFKISKYWLNFPTPGFLNLINYNH